MSRIFKLFCACLLVAQLFFISSPAAIAQPAGPCVADYPELPCTRDINPCGNPSQCICPPGYSYNASVGACLVDDLYLADGPGAPVESKCTSPPQDICTLDINVCGNASICMCPDGTTYSPVIGECIVDLPPY
ncbi:MAG: hypothetical protein F6J92_17770 [Symploca sp. SIO1A3]|nr:hypothetical protein [Symploca sp. SIO1A3]